MSDEGAREARVITQAICVFAANETAEAQQLPALQFIMNRADRMAGAIQDALSRSPPVSDRDGEVERGWLIEEEVFGELHWIALSEDRWPKTSIKLTRHALIQKDEYRTPVRRVKDANDALRFARKEDAEAFAELFDLFLLSPVVKITEHEWPALASLPHPEREERPCTCHPDDRPDGPCPRKFAASDCAAVEREERLKEALEKWKDLALRAIDCLHDVERETDWGQPTFGKSVWEGLRDEQNDLLALALKDQTR